MKVFLVVIFMVGGEPFIMDGFQPRESDGFAECSERREFLTEHLSTMPGLTPNLSTCILAPNAGEAVLEVIRERKM